MRPITQTDLLASVLGECFPGRTPEEHTKAAQRLALDASRVGDDGSPSMLPERVGGPFRCPICDGKLMFENDDPSVGIVGKEWVCYGVDCPYVIERGEPYARPYDGELEGGEE